MSNKYAPIESVKPVAISVIVPIDNTEKYLEGNLQSVQQQSFDNWELILVDNGSTDSSLRIVQSFAQSDERISVIPFKKKQNSKEEALKSQPILQYKMPKANTLLSSIVAIYTIQIFGKALRPFRTSCSILLTIYLAIFQLPLKNYYRGLQDMHMLSLDKEIALIGF